MKEKITLDTGITYMSEQFYNVGQELPSMDCGYFCGYVVSLWDKRGLMMMSREEVYRARNHYKNPSKPNDTPAGPERGTPGLNSGTGMVNYLTSMKCHGYKADWANSEYHHGGIGGGEEIRTILHRHTPPGRSNDALILAINSAISGHWVAILNPGNNQYIYYDPGRHTAPYAALASEEKVLNELYQRGVYRIVSSHDDSQARDRTHTVTNGDTLSGIAGRYLDGDVLLWPLIYDANVSKIGPDWNRLKVNTKLSIPIISKFTTAQLNEARQRGRTW